jgi:murein DD-endopeptidase MepM/ murein hydrolase activator NlpD
VVHVPPGTVARIAARQGDVDGQPMELGELLAPGDRLVVARGGKGGRGNVISIDHGNGMQTVYNHLGGFAIGTGTYVAPGQIIGYVGCTGMCTGPHVHFEVIVGGVIVNPLRYL